MRIAFFISDHGYGHLMRNIAVIEYLADNGNDIVVVTGEKHIGVAREYLSDKVDYVAHHMDVGLILKPGTLLIDEARLVSAVEKYVCDFDEYVDFAKLIYRDYGIQKAVVDISPWAIRAAREAEVESYFMASFSWVEQYEGLVDEKYVSVLRTAYQSVDHILYYELANRNVKNMLGYGMEIGLVARLFDNEKVQQIKSEHKRQMVFLSLGVSNSGLDFDIDVSNLPYDFIATPALRIKGDNVYYLNPNIPNTQDYVKAADYCISKAGWTTVAEMLLAGCRFAVLNRPDVPEDTMIIEELTARRAAVGIDVDELKDMGAVMKALTDYPFEKREYENGYIRCAEEVLK